MQTRKYIGHRISNITRVLAMALAVAACSLPNIPIESAGPPSGAQDNDGGGGDSGGGGGY